MSDFSMVANPGLDDSLLDAYLEDTVETNPEKKKKKRKKKKTTTSNRKPRKKKGITLSISPDDLLNELRKTELIPAYAIPRKKRKGRKKTKKNPVVEILEGLAGNTNPKSKKRRKTRRKSYRRNPQTGAMDVLFTALGVTIGWVIGRLITTGVSKIKFFQTAEMTPNYFAYAAPLALPIIPPIKNSLESLTKGMTLPFTWDAVFAGLGVSAIFGIAKPFIANMSETSKIKEFLQTMLGQDDSSPIIIIPAGQISTPEIDTIPEMDIRTEGTQGLEDWGPEPTAGWGE